MWQKLQVQISIDIRGSLPLKELSTFKKENAHRI